MSKPGFQRAFMDALISKVADILAARLAPRIEAALFEQLKPLVDPYVSERLKLVTPDIEIYRSAPDAPFMPFSNCQAADFRHPEFRRYADIIGSKVFYHRKLWEYVFILHHAFRNGAIGEGKTALGFGVGSEPLPSAFVMGGSDVTATDAPLDIAVYKGWAKGTEFAKALESIPNGAMDRAAFEAKMKFQSCDMNEIDPALTGFDFCWSSCALEHLGSLRKGMDFIINSVEKTLKLGGVAVHTTEFNMSSNEETLDHAWTVLYRRRDFEELIAELRDRGHEVESFAVGPDITPVDRYVDVPPYTEQVHLKLQLEGYVTSSAGLVIRRGK